MRIVFMGTPQFAVPTLRRLLEDGQEVVGVFTQVDKPKGRGYSLAMSPVKELALEKGLPLFQPATLKTPEAAEQIVALRPDLIVVVAYGKILPKRILDIPPLGCVNIHASLLPELRGAAPIQWAVILGKRETGITLMQMEEGLDTGGILWKRKTHIDPDDTSGDLFERLSHLGAEALSFTLPHLERREVTPEPQREELATYAPMLTKEMCELDWNKPAEELHNLVRGLTPFLTARTRSGGKTLKIHKTRLSMLFSKGHSVGEILMEDGFPCVVCGEGVLTLLEVQLEGKKRTSAADFVRGNVLQLTPLATPLPKE